MSASTSGTNRISDTAKVSNINSSTGAITFTADAGNPVTGSFSGSNNVTFFKTMGQSTNDVITTSYVLNKLEKYCIRIRFFIPNSAAGGDAGKQIEFNVTGPLQGSSTSDLRYTSLYETDYDLSDTGKGIFENFIDNSIKFGGTSLISGLGGLRSAIRFAFNGKVNEISDILENDEYYVICRIDSINPPGIKFFEEVKSQISRKLDQEKTKQATLEEANNLLIKLSSSGSTLGDFIKSEKLKDSFENETKTLSQGFTSIGISHFINGELMNSSPGKVLGPFETNRGHAIVELVSMEELDTIKLEDQQSQIRDILFSRKQSQLFQEWINGLKI